MAGTLGRNQHYVQILAWLDQFVIDVETMREQDGGAERNIRQHQLVQIFLRQVRYQKGNQLGAFHCFGRFSDGQTVLLGLFPAVAVLA